MSHTSYVVYEVRAQQATFIRGEFDALDAAEERAGAYSRWYIVEKVETERMIERCVVARSAESEKPGDQQSPKTSRLERAQARMDDRRFGGAS